jgi:hypothetical protein
MEILSFQEALKASEPYNKRHLLLGNGFSIACIPTIFTYDSLYSQADFGDMIEAKKAFELLRTQDFELIISSLNNAGAILPAYLPKEEQSIKLILQHATKLKERLIETIARNHPEFPAEIDDKKYNNCIHFLSNFLDTGNSVYTLNYDLLLYWTLMYGLEKKLIKTDPVDGFGRETDFENGEISVSEYVTWQGDSKAHGQNVHYLHGALHLYDRGIDVEKFTWIDKGIRLIDQARKALSENRFPLFVAEGESGKKMEKIIHSGYLYHSFKSFSSAMKAGKKSSKGCLFTYGVSFSKNDEHILCKIPKGKVAHLFVSIYGSPDSLENKQIIDQAEELKRRRSYTDLSISYYDAASAKVWG